MHLTKTFAVNAICNGTVIDHIQAGQALKITTLLGLEQHARQVTLGLNLPSLILTHKDLIKIEEWELNQDEINHVALFSPKATFNIIQNYEVVRKFKASIPNVVSWIILCRNPQCITNHERTQRTFHIKEQFNTLILQCHYCRKQFKQDEIQTIPTK